MQQRIEDIVNGLLEKMRAHGLSDSTVNQYQRGFCKRIMRYCHEHGDGCYSSSVLDAFLSSVKKQLKEGEIQLHHYQTTERTVRYLKDYAESGNVNFAIVVNTRKYNPNKKHLNLIEQILKETDLQEKFKNRLHCCMRHFFVFVESLGINDYEITGDMIRRFINEASKTNAGSMNYIIYSINLITKNLKRNKIADMQSDFHYFMPKSTPIRLILPYTQEEINRILQAIKSDSISAKRNRAIILLAFNTGLRGIDIVNLQLSDIDWKTGVVRVVQSKTKYPVTIPICGMVMNAIADYILEERPACDEKSVFLKAVSPHAPLKGTSSLDSILEKLCRKAGVEKKPYRSFHSLRRSFATELSVAEVPLTSISQMLGHQSIDSDRPF